MKLQEFIISAFKQIKNKFPECELAYQYKEISETHFFKVEPKVVYKSGAFFELEDKLVGAFESLLVEEDLCFISSDSLTQLDKPSLYYSPGLNSGLDFQTSFVNKTELKIGFATTIKLSLKKRKVTNHQFHGQHKNQHYLDENNQFSNLAA